MTHLDAADIETLLSRLVHQTHAEGATDVVLVCRHKGTPHSLDVVCPHAQAAPAFQMFDGDPFHGRTPSARELNAMFADGGRVKWPTIAGTRLPTVRLEHYAVAYNVPRRGAPGARYDWTLFVGRCPDCGRVLYSLPENL